MGNNRDLRVETKYDFQRRKVTKMAKNDQKEIAALQHGLLPVQQYSTVGHCQCQAF